MGVGGVLHGNPWDGMWETLSPKAYLGGLIPLVFSVTSPQSGKH